MARIQRVTPHELTQIMNVGQPVGRYYTFDNNKFVGLEVTEDSRFIRGFERKKDCFKWLKAPEVYNNKEWNELQKLIKKRLDSEVK